MHTHLNVTHIITSHLLPQKVRCAALFAGHVGHELVCIMPACMVHRCSGFNEWSSGSMQ